MTPVRKTAFLGCFWPWWDSILKQIINQHVLRAPLLLHPSVCPSVTWSIHAETQPGRIVARSGLFLYLTIKLRWTLRLEKSRAHGSTTRFPGWGPLAFFGINVRFYITAPAPILGLAFFITAPAHPHATNSPAYSVSLCMHMKHSNYECPLISMSKYLFPSLIIIGYATL